MSSIRVLVVDDEPSFLEALTPGLRREGFEVISASDGEQALALADRERPDLILLDVMLPRISGLDVCRRIRQVSDVPIIMVSARGEEIDTVVGLEVGADDYVTKPYRLRELVARMRAVVRRRDKVAAEMPEVPSGDVLVSGPLILDTGRHQVTVHGRAVHLPLKEFAILELLMESPGRVITRSSLMNNVWGHDHVGDTKTLDVHIRRLRRRIDGDDSARSLITTVRGVGYRLDPEPRV